MNLLLVTLDCLRRDHVSFYGAGKAETPSLDALACESAVLEEAVSVANTTAASHASLLTARYPKTHGVRVNGVRHALPADALQHVLGGHGFARAAAVGVYHLDPKFGWAAGFDAFFGVQRPLRRVLAPLAWAGMALARDKKAMAQRLQRWGIAQPYRRSARQTAALALRWLQRSRGRPWFLWTHFFDLHAPSPRPYRERVERLDTELGAFFRCLEKDGFLEETLAVVTADHGEQLEGWHAGDHGHTLYDDELLVPLFFHLPGRVPARRVTGQASTLEVAPTALALASLEKPASWEGTSLVPWLEGRRQGAARNEVFCEAYPEYTRSWCLRAPPWKYIYHARGGEELYRLDKDPGEKHDLAGEESEKARALRARLKAWLEGDAGQGLEAGKARDRETRRALKGLGYL